MTRYVAVSLNVISDNQHHIARVIEVMSRAAAGLALDGIETDLIAGPGICDHDEEEAA